MVGIVQYPKEVIFFLEHVYNEKWYLICFFFSFYLQSKDSKLTILF